MILFNIKIVISISSLINHNFILPQIISRYDSTKQSITRKVKTYDSEHEKDSDNSMKLIEFHFVKSIPNDITLYVKYYNNHNLVTLIVFHPELVRENSYFI
jgi:hypothetical protein